MLFGSKPKRNDVPIAEVRKMMDQGMTDKQIIDELKKQGYSMDLIEKAMLQMVKTEPEPSLDIPKFDDSPLDLDEPVPDPLEDLDHLSDVGEEGGIENPEDIVEELVEGIIEDKMKSVSKEIEGLKEKFAGIRSDIEEIRKARKQNIDVSDLTIRVNEMETKLMDLGVRVGALEKAFKQLLPSLVDNVHNLSRLVHELKQSHHELRNEVSKRSDFSPPAIKEEPSQNKESRAQQPLTEEDIKRILGQA